ncbi:hypothetical protein OAI15_01470 [Flavobacteriaceae bacterium]|nr:hypothetical protein [Flavobacteriaceae bacterium]
MKKIIDYTDPFKALDDEKIAFRVLLEAVKREATKMIHRTNPDEVLDTVEITKQKPNKRSLQHLYMTPQEAYRNHLIEEYTNNDRMVKDDILEPVEVEKIVTKKKKIRRSKLHNLIKDEILGIAAQREKQRRRKLALRKLAK